jgi:hypothetical protein
MVSNTRFYLRLKAKFMNNSATHYATSRIELLELIINKKQWPDDLNVNQLNNLKLFCKYTNKKIGISECSLNTLKSSVKNAIAENDNNNSWGYFKIKVKEAINVISLCDNPSHKEFKRGTKDYFKAQRDEERISNKILVNDVARLSDQYFNLVNICQLYAKKDAAFTDDFFKHLGKYKKSQSQLILVKKGN